VLGRATVAAPAHTDLMPRRGHHPYGHLLVTSPVGRSGQEIDPPRRVTDCLPAMLHGISGELVTEDVGDQT